MINAPAIIAKAYINFSRPIKRRGLYRTMQYINRIFPRQAAEVHTTTLGDSVFCFPASDPFWLVKTLSGKRHEPAIHDLISRLSEKPILFVDCGANFGYWSVVMSEISSTVAIEGSRTTFDWLVRNNDINNHRFIALHAAISDGSCAEVCFATGGNHAGRGIITEGNHVERVPALTIDSVVDNYSKCDGLIFVKIDVEGAEVSAFVGAKSAFQSRSIFVYEDHGKDDQCTPSDYLLRQNRKIFYIKEGGKLEPVYDLDHVREIKKSRSIGYDFATFGGSEVEQESLVNKLVG